MFGTIWAGLKGLGSIASFAAKWVGWKKDRDLRESGAAMEREKFNKESRDVEKRMDDTGRPDSDSVADSLRDGKF